MKTTQFSITSRESGITLLDLLAKRLKVSKKKAKAILDTRSVFVNDHRVWMARHPLSPRDKVTINLPRPSSRQHPITILHEDDDYMVANKPAGMLANEESSVEEKLRDERQLPALTAAHRLDRDTSGCLILAKNPAALEAIQLVFKKRQVKKAYHAIVSGHVERDARSITMPIQGQRAVTRARRLDGNRKAAHLLITIETGRTHQIRKHLASIRHPVIGDRYYGMNRSSDASTMKIGRQMLHAAKIEFRHPVSGQIVRAKAPLPPDFRRCLKSLGLT